MTEQSQSSVPVGSGDNVVRFQRPGNRPTHRPGIHTAEQPGDGEPVVRNRGGYATSDATRSSPTAEIVLTERSESRATGEAEESVVLQQSGLAGIWLMMWVLVAFSGAIYAGMQIGAGIMPWSSLDAAKPWGGMLVGTIVLIQLEDNLGGDPARLIRRLVGPMLVGAVAGWCVTSPVVVKFIHHFIR
jgi:hypothetical protein